MLSEYLTQQYEQIEEILDSNHKNIAQQEKDQGIMSICYSYCLGNHDTRKGVKQTTKILGSRIYSRYLFFLLFFAPTTKCTRFSSRTSTGADPVIPERNEERVRNLWRERLLKQEEEPTTSTKKSIDGWIVRPFLYHHQYASLCISFNSCDTCGVELCNMQ